MHRTSEDSLSRAPIGVAAAATASRRGRHCESSRQRMGLGRDGVVAGKEVHWWRWNWMVCDMSGADSSSNKSIAVYIFFLMRTFEIFSSKLFSGQAMVGDEVLPW